MFFIAIVLSSISLSFALFVYLFIMSLRFLKPWITEQPTRQIHPLILQPLPPLLPPSAPPPDINLC